MSQVFTMRCAIIAVTPNGAVMAEKLRLSLDAAVDIYGKRDKYGSNEAIKPFDKMGSIMRQLFTQYDALIFFCAVGIAVRMTAPYIVRKDRDPAVIAVDEQGHFAVSLLSGHLGGANELTQKVSQILGAVPVITTATDVNGIMAPDMIAGRLGFAVKPLESIKVFNAALLAGENIAYYIDKAEPDAMRYKSMLKEQNINAVIVDTDTDKIKSTESLSVLITDKVIQNKNILCFARHKLIAGIGCRRGTSQEHIEDCLQQACHMINYDIRDVVLISSTQLKADEQGILQTAEKYAIPAKFWGNDVLGQIILQYGLQESPFVTKQIGIGNVCEAAALASGGVKLVLNKTKFEKVTVALAWEK